MLPYFEQPGFSLGPLTIHAFSALAAAAVVAGWWLAVRRARRTGLHEATASRLCRVTILAGFFGAWIARTQIYAPGTWTGFSSFGGLFLGLAAGVAFLHWGAAVRGERMWRYLDCISFVFPAAWLIGRAGCALAHDHPGIRATGSLTVAFPDGPRYDLGLLQMLSMIPFILLFLLLDRWQWPAGFYTGLFLVLYGPLRFAQDLLHETRPAYFGLGADQWGGALAALVGVLVFVLSPPARAPAS